ncbi:MAG TPA: winged helix-turn-helix domain-containing protein, partial [Pyrinomonadaceae bacterium]
NHRVYIIFSEFLTREAFNELIEAMMRTLDELTPYYQERIRWLSPQQRKIVELLCDRGNALSVKEIAARNFMTHQTASGQLKALREKGYVKDNPIGRESYYELREPLMRLCVEVKKHRDKPIRLIVDLLRSWYTTEELRERLEYLPETPLEEEERGGPRSEREHIQAALSQYQSAEILFALSNTNRVHQALFSLLLKEEAERETNARIVAEAARKMAHLAMRGYQFESDWVSGSYEDVAQTALLELFALIENRAEKIISSGNPVGYLNALIRRTARDFWRTRQRQTEVEISDQTIPRSNVESEPLSVERMSDLENVNPDRLLELRALLLQKTQSYLLEDYLNIRVLKKRISDLAVELKAAGADDVFGESLIRCSLYLSEAALREQNPSQLKKWFGVVKEELKDSDEFMVALRVISKIVSYTETGDRRVLFELRPEERTFLEPLIKNEKQS